MDDLDQSYLDAIKGFEGYSPNASWDYKQYSSGYGTKAQPGDENIPPGQQKQVYEQRFQDEVGKAAASVDAFAPNLPAGVRAALTSLTYNAGPGWQQSGLGAAIKAGDYDTAKSLFQQYNKAGGEVNPGLVARRAQEASWFGGNGPQGAQTASASAPQGLPPPQQQAPIFPQQQAQAPTVPLGGGLGGGQSNLFGQLPAQTPQPQQQQPYFAPLPQPIDFTALKQALGNRGFFNG